VFAILTNLAYYRRHKMAAEDIHVRLCLQEIVKLDLEVKAIVQVGIQK